MKKLVLVALGAVSFFSSFAQTNSKGVRKNLDFSPVLSMDVVASKTTADGDTLSKVNFDVSQLDSMANYRIGSTPYDSGFVYGPNPFGDKAWAERFDFNGNDSSVKVIGTFALFGGRLNTVMPPSHTINFKVWGQSAWSTAANFGANWKYNGLPGATLLTSQNISINNLGIDISGAGADTIKAFLFSTASNYIADSFFVGYTPNWSFSASNGDTIGLKTTRDGYRYAPYYFVAGTDTIINVKNVTQYSDNSWADNAFENFQLGHHLAIFPILVVKYNANAVNGVSKNNLELFGNYPNPASSVTNIKIALKKAARVDVSITDMSGRVIKTISRDLNAGAALIAVETADMAAGNYLYLVRTSEGDGVASTFSVVR